jgi:drug/metabolite transporter (DMT)-like permease
MLKNLSPRVRAILLALFVTFLWSTSWVLIKFGLQDIPPVTFAGLRFFLAFLVLIPIYLRSSSATPLRQLTRRDWASLLGLGVLYYTITQGSMFVTLVYLPAITFSMLLNGTAVVVAILGIFLLREMPTRMQWLGMLVFFSGVLLFFYPLNIPAALLVGYLFAAIHILANSLSAIAGRGINRQKRIHPLTVTIVSMGIGSMVMLGTGLLIEPIPRLSWSNWAIIAWLAVVNTAFTFTLWNLTQRTLTAVESSVINNTMLIQISILAVLFLDATLTWIEVVGLILAALGALLVQLRR